MGRRPYRASAAAMARASRLLGSSPLLVLVVSAADCVSFSSARFTAASLRDALTRCRLDTQNTGYRRRQPHSNTEFTTSYCDQHYHNSNTATSSGSTTTTSNTTTTTTSSSSSNNDLRSCWHGKLKHADTP
jgi:hypothetical protein